MDPGEPQARRALRLPPSGQKEVLERQRIMHGGAGRVIEYPAYAFDIENVHLKFTRGALQGIAREALKRKSGARGLRAIMESIMVDLMYEIPSQPNMMEVTISEVV
jgi:ATP-dependent Clp protease ATP-binding subunit ClpX